MANNKKITIVLSDANAWDLNVVSMILNKPIAEIVSHCLTRFNQPCDTIRAIKEEIYDEQYAINKENESQFATR